MKHYEEAATLVDILKDLVEQHPIHAETAEGWFNIAHTLLEIVYAIRRDAWQALPADAKQRLMGEDQKLRHIDSCFDEQLAGRETMDDAVRRRLEELGAEWADDVDITHGTDNAALNKYWTEGEVIRDILTIIDGRGIKIMDALAVAIVSAEERLGERVTANSVN